MLLILTQVQNLFNNPQKKNYDFEIHYLLFEKDFCGEWESMQMNLLNWNAFSNLMKIYIMVCIYDMNEIRNYIIRITNEYYEDALTKQCIIREYA